MTQPFEYEIENKEYLTKPVLPESKDKGRPGRAIEFKTFDSGCMRTKDADSVRWDLIPSKALEEIAEALREGAEKYDDDNWRKGMPYSEVVNHLLNHINKFIQGDKSENHLSHAACNVLFLMEYESNKEKYSSQNDLYYHGSNS